MINRQISNPDVCFLARILRGSRTHHYMLASDFSFAWSKGPLDHIKVSLLFLVNLLFLIHAQLTGSHVHQQQQATHDGKDLEEIVFGEVLVRVVLVQLER